jgi:hypothetical protein
MRNIEDCKLPPVGTMARSILDYFNDVGVAANESARHDMSGEFDRDQITRTIADLRASRLLARCDGGFRVSATGRAKYDQEKKAQRSTGQIVPHAVHNVFATTLDPKKLPSVLGMREGSNEYRNWPSKYN